MRIAIANPTGGGMSGGYVKYLYGVVPELMRHPAVAAVRVFVAPTLKGRLQDLPLEAISIGEWPRHNCPCVSVRRDPMPEFFGDAAVYVARDDDAEALSDALCVVLEAPDRAALLRRRAISRASLYTWSMTALRTVEELQCAIAHPHFR